MKQKSFDDFREGDVFSKKFKITDKMVTEYAYLVGDKNPIHLDPSYASKSIFGQRVAHGTLLSGLISSLLGMEFPGEGTILLSQKVKFLKPVFINDEIKMTLTLFKKEVGKNFLIIDTSCFKDDNFQVLEGTATVKFE